MKKWFTRRIADIKFWSPWCLAIFGSALFTWALIYGYEDFQARKLAVATHAAIQASDGELSISQANFDEILRNIEQNYVDKENLPSRAEMIQIAIDAVMKEIGDTHGRFLVPHEYEMVQDSINPRVFGGVGIDITGFENGSNFEILLLRLHDNSPLKIFDVEPGDTISHVNGEQITKANYFEMVNNIRGTIGTDVRLTVKKHSSTVLGELTIQRVRTTPKTVFAKERGCYVHLRITQFTNNPKREMNSELAPLLKKCGGGFKGMVLDMRSNPGGSLGGGLIVEDHFLKKGTVMLKTIGRSESVGNREWKARFEDVFPDELPVVVLMNGGSASASEIVAGGIRKHRTMTVILGTKSYGKGSVQTLYPTGDGTAIKITTARYLAGGTVEVDGVGLEPNLVVEQPTAPGGIERYEAINRIMIANAMDPALDHQLQVAYVFLAELTRLNMTPGYNKTKALTDAFKRIENYEPSKIEKEKCEAAGLRGCSNTTNFRQPHPRNRGYPPQMP